MNAVATNMSSSAPAEQLPQDPPPDVKHPFRMAQPEPVSAPPAVSYAQAAKAKPAVGNNSPKNATSLPSTEPKLGAKGSSQEKISKDTEVQATKRTVSEGQMHHRASSVQKETDQAHFNAQNEKKTVAPSKQNGQSTRVSTSLPCSPHQSAISASIMSDKLDLMPQTNGYSDTVDGDPMQTRSGGQSNEKNDDVDPEKATEPASEPNSAGPALKDAPPPIRNIWQQRKEAQQAKVKAQPPKMPVRSSPTANGIESTSVPTASKSTESQQEQQKRSEGKRKGKEERSNGENAKGASKESRGKDHSEGSKTNSIPPHPGDAHSWPTPDTAVTDEKKRLPPVQKTEDVEKEKEITQNPKPSGKKGWTQIPFVPTAVFNTPLPQARRGGRGPSSGRENPARGRNGASNRDGGDKNNGSASGEKGKSNAISSTQRAGSKSRRASSAGPIASKEQRTGSEAAQNEKRKESGTDDRPTRQNARNHSDSRRSFPVPIPATPHVGRSASHAPTSRSAQFMDQAPGQNRSSEPDVTSPSSTTQTHTKSTDPKHQNSFSSGTGETKELTINTSRTERGEEKGGRGRGNHRSRGQPNQAPYSAHPQSASAYTNGAPYQYPAPTPFVPTSRSFSNHDRISPQAQSPSYPPPPPPHHRSFRPSSRTQWNPGFVTAGGRYPNGPGIGHPQLPTLQTDLTNMVGFPPAAPTIMSAIPYNPYEEQVTLFDMVTLQMEYYFSLDNLCKDLFLRKQMDSQGFVFLSVLTGFNRIVSLTTDIELIRYVCLNSARIEFRPGQLWQDGRDRLRAREGWQNFVLRKQDRDPSAQTDGPVPAQRPAEHDFVPATEEYRSVSPHSHPQQGVAEPPQEPMTMQSPPSSRPQPAVPITNGVHASLNSTPLSAAVAEFSPSAQAHSGRRYASPDPRGHDTKAFTDEEVQNLQILVRQPVNAGQPSFHSASSRTFSNGSIDSRKIGEEILGLGEQQARPLNGEGSESGVSDSQRSIRSRSPFPVGSPTKRPEASQSPPVFWMKNKEAGSTLETLPNDLHTESYLDFRREALKEREQAHGAKTTVPMQNLYNFWSHFLVRNFNPPMYEEFRQLAKDDLSLRKSSHGMQSLIQYYDEALLGHRTSLDDNIARHYVDMVVEERQSGDRPAFKKLRAAWRNGAFNHKNRHKIFKIIDADLKAELDR